MRRNLVLPLAGLLLLACVGFYAASDGKGRAGIRLAELSFVLSQGTNRPGGDHALGSSYFLARPSLA